MKYKRMAQFRYYGEGNPYNFPDNIMQIESGKVVCPTEVSLLKYRPISSINIATIPGVILYLHINDTEDTVLKYIVGATGILNFDDLYFGIQGIEIDTKSAEILKANKENFFILTITYEIELKEEEEE